MPAPYSTQAQLETRYSTTMLLQLSDRGQIGGGVSVDADLIAEAITRADNLIDGFLAARYQLPLATNPVTITDISQRIAIYYAHGQVAGDKITADYTQALKQLSQISKGEIVLQVAGIEASGSGANEVETNYSERVLTNDSLKGFI